LLLATERAEGQGCCEDKGGLASHGGGGYTKATIHNPLDAASALVPERILG
jgi:hypothetical protein